MGRHGRSGCHVTARPNAASSAVAELLGALYGLGFLIGDSETFPRIPELYATVVAAALFAGIVYVLFELLDRKLIFWRPRETRR